MLDKPFPKSRSYTSDCSNGKPYSRTPLNRRSSAIRNHAGAPAKFGRPHAQLGLAFAPCCPYSYFGFSGNYFSMVLMANTIAPILSRYLFPSLIPPFNLHSENLQPFYKQALVKSNGWICEDFFLWLEGSLAAVSELNLFSQFYYGEASQL